MTDITVQEPNDLLRLCYEYGVNELPVSENGLIQGTIKKKDLVRFFSNTSRFNLNLIQLIEKLVRSADPSLLDELRDKLENGRVGGIPILGYDGEIQRVITPGVLQTEKKSRQFLDQAAQIELYETLLNWMPFPVEVSHDERTIFTNESYDKKSSRACEWDENTLQIQGFSVTVLLPKPVRKIIDAHNKISADSSIDLRNLIDTIEYHLMNQAHQLTDSISDAAEKVGLPRQTFNYRWNKKESDEN